jgi:hypothetical protein
VSCYWKSSASPLRTAERDQPATGPQAGRGEHAGGGGDAAGRAHRVGGPDRSGRRARRAAGAGNTAVSAGSVTWRSNWPGRMAPRSSRRGHRAAWRPSRASVQSRLTTPPRRSRTKLAPVPAAAGRRWTRPSLRPAPTPGTSSARAGGARTPWRRWRFARRPTPVSSPCCPCSPAVVASGTDGSCVPSPLSPTRARCGRCWIRAGSAWRAVMPPTSMWRTAPATVDLWSSMPTAPPRSRSASRTRRCWLCGRQPQGSCSAGPKSSRG